MKRALSILSLIMAFCILLSCTVTGASAAEEPQPPFYVRYQYEMRAAGLPKTIQAQFDYDQNFCEVASDYYTENYGAGQVPKIEKPRSSRRPNPVTTDTVPASYALRNPCHRTVVRINIDHHLISRVSSRTSASEAFSTNCEISSIKLSAMALCGTIATTPITMIWCVSCSSISATDTWKRF